MARSAALKHSRVAERGEDPSFAALDVVASAGATAKPAAAPLALGPLATVVGYHLACASATTFDLYERHVGKPFGLRKVEFSLLMLLLANGPVAPKRLAATLVLSPPKLTMLLDRLQDRGLLRRERNPDDGRSQHIVLTDSGRRLALDSARAGKPMEEELLDRLSRAEQAMLIELLGKLAGTAG